jgi:hypothetical protein
MKRQHEGSPEDTERTPLIQRLSDGTTPRIVAELSHDLRQPLTSLNMNLQSAVKLLQQANPRVSAALEALTDCLNTEHDIVELIESAKRRASALSARAGAFALNHLAIDITSTACGFEPSWRSRVRKRLVTPSPLVSPSVVRLRTSLLSTLQRALTADGSEAPTSEGILVETRSRDGQAELLLHGLPPSLPTAWNYQGLRTLTTTLVSQLQGAMHIDVNDAHAELVISLPTVEPLTPLMEAPNHGD